MQEKTDNPKPTTETQNHLENKLEKLFQLYEETQKKLDDLECNYLQHSCLLKDKSLAEVLIELWKQAKEGSATLKL
jgi:hypothetical protein